jgi:hypothetical protein
MTRTKEEYVAIGSEFPSERMLDQTDYSLGLATRDAALLAGHGWPVKRTEELLGIRADLTQANLGYEQKFGMHVGVTRVNASQVDLGKRWRLRARAIGENELTGEDALARLRRLGGAAGRDPGSLGRQIVGLLQLARENEAVFRDGGADDAFFAEGDRLVGALEQGEATRRQRPRDLPAEHDKLDELDGRAWELLKKLNRSGKATHIARGDRGRAAEFNLDILYGHPVRRASGPTAPPTPTPAT